jgi:GWxTD domain-containing protein
MPHRPNAFVALFALLLAGAAGTLAADLDKDEKEWLDDVRPIILKDEKKIFEDLEDRADRDEFRLIFWARRDADLEAPGNEFQDAFEVSREEADKRFRVTGRRGSWTDCGRTFILLGEPDDSDALPGSGSVLQRVPETWTYFDKPGRTFQGGEAKISFDSECRAPSAIEDVLENISASMVRQPQLSYTKGEDGHLVSLEDQLPKDTPAQALLKAPRQDFPLTAEASYLRVSEDVTGVVGLLRGEPGDVDTMEAHGLKSVAITVVTSAVAEGGEDAGWTEQPVMAAVQDDGSFVASFGIALGPGNYTLKAGVILGEGPKASLVSQSIEVPDLSQVETAADGTTTKKPSVASILFIKDIEEGEGDEADPTHPYAAFRLGKAQLIPFYGSEFTQEDTVSFFYLVYDLAVDPATEKADAAVAFSLLKNGRTPVAQAPENTVETAVVASSIGPVPLSAYPPGNYVVQLRVTDRISKKTVVKNERFTIVGPESGAE